MASPEKPSSTIRSFASSVNRRRRPVPTISRRLTVRKLSLSLSIRTKRQIHSSPSRRPRSDAYRISTSYHCHVAVRKQQQRHCPEGMRRPAKAPQEMRGLCANHKRGSDLCREFRRKREGDLAGKLGEDEGDRPGHDKLDRPYRQPLPGGGEPR